MHIMATCTSQAQISVSKAFPCSRADSPYHSRVTAAVAESRSRRPGHTLSQYRFKRRSLRTGLYLHGSCGLLGQRPHCFRAASSAPRFLQLHRNLSLAPGVIVCGLPAVLESVLQQEMRADGFAVRTALLHLRECCLSPACFCTGCMLTYAGHASTNACSQAASNAGRMETMHIKATCTSQARISVSKAFPCSRADSPYHSRVTAAVAESRSRRPGHTLSQYRFKRRSLRTGLYLHGSCGLLGQRPLCFRAASSAPRFLQLHRNLSLAPGVIVCGLPAVLEPVLQQEMRADGFAVRTAMLHFRSAA